MSLRAIQRCKFHLSTLSVIRRIVFWLAKLYKIPINFKVQTADKVSFVDHFGESPIELLG